MATNPRTYTLAESREITDALAIVRSALDGAYQDLKDGVEDRKEEYKNAYLGGLAVLNDLEITTYLTEDFEAEVVKASPQPTILTVTNRDPGPFVSGQDTRLIGTVMDGFGRKLDDAQVSWEASDAETGVGINVQFTIATDTHIATVKWPTVAQPTDVSIRIRSMNNRSGGSIFTVSPA